MDLQPGGLGNGLPQRRDARAAAAEIQLLQLPVPVVVIVEIHGPDDLARETGVKLLGVIGFQHAVIVAVLIAVGHMDVHAAVVGNEAVQLRAADLHAPAAVKAAAVENVEICTAVTKAHDAAVGILTAVMGDVLLQQRAVSALVRRQHPLAEARPAEHGPVFLHGGFQHGAGEQLHLLRLPVRAVQNALHGIIKKVAVLFLRQKIPEFIGQVVAELLLRHQRQRHGAHKAVAGVQHHGGVRQGDAVALGHVPDKICHGVHGQNSPV